jgi:hypothetical protein
MDYVFEVLKQGNEKTKQIAEERMNEVKKICGLGM